MIYRAALRLSVLSSGTTFFKQWAFFYKSDLKMKILETYETLWGYLKETGLVKISIALW